MMSSVVVLLCLLFERVSAGRAGEIPVGLVAGRSSSVLKFSVVTVDDDGAVSSSFPGLSVVACSGTVVNGVVDVAVRAGVPKLPDATLVVFAGFVGVRGFGVTDTVVRFVGLPLSRLFLLPIVLDACVCV